MAAIEILAGAPRQAAELRQLAQCFYEINDDFYGLFSVPQRVVAVIEDLIGDVDADFAGLRCAYREGVLAGAFCAYPAIEMAARQLRALRPLLALSGFQSELREKLRAFSEARQAVRVPSCYLARIFVATEFRGLGLGRALLSDFHDYAEGSGFDEASLHVHNRNVEALALYRSAGYEFRDTTRALVYRAMSRRLGA
jgi:ribosomal protein S18 acetylase RimI-like enzyme